MKWVLRDIGAQFTCTMICVFLSAVVWFWWKCRGGGDD